MLRRTTKGQACANGPLEPLAFLLVKRDIPVPDGKRHHQVKVPQQDVIARLSDDAVLTALSEVYEACAGLAVHDE